jgi:fatty-acyl-CoA synthase
MPPHEHLNAAGDLAHPGSCGRANLLSIVEIMDDDGRILPPGERGEIVVRGPLVMQGYYNDPAATAAVSAHGWHHTGDIGLRDADGWFYVVDRKKDMIITGGFNVYPADVERAITDHPGVQDCAVVGAPSDEWGEVVTAVVELKPGVAVSAEEMLAWCRSRLSGVKTPKAIHFTRELPRSAVGKVLRRRVREQFWVGRDRAI